MKHNTRSSISLPPRELQLLLSLQKKLGAKSKLEVVRRGLQLLREATDRTALREAYRHASRATQEGLLADLAELAELTTEGLDRE